MQFVLKDVILDGANFLKPNCPYETCKYCPYLNEINSTVYMNDRNESVNYDNYVTYCNYLYENADIKGLISIG